MSDLESDVVAGPGIWQEDVGYVPYKVTIMEMENRKRVLYLRWRADGNWRYESLGRTLFDDNGKRLKGRTLTEVQRWARERAKAKHHELVSGVSQSIAIPLAPLTIGETWAKVSDPKTGLYPVETPHRKEVRAQLIHAGRIWGNDRIWNTIGKPELLALGRVRVDELASDTDDNRRRGVGYRGAEITVSRILTVAQWLRDQDAISATAAVPAKGWKSQLKTYWSQRRGVHGAPPVSRPRHTIDEMRKILEASAKVDPRLHLILQLGAELRLGQVARAWRSHVDLEKGTFTIESSGKKRGTIERLTPGQIAVVQDVLANGYLRELETVYLETREDYRLFPDGQLTGGRKGTPVVHVKRTRFSRAAGSKRSLAGSSPIAATTIRDWFKEAEKIAGVPSIKGRVAYGLRRVAVDEAKRLGISREGLMSHGGWTDTQVPDSIYADQDAVYAAEEAMGIRVKIRGENPAASNDFEKQEP